MNSRSSSWLALFAALAILSINIDITAEARGRRGCSPRSDCCWGPCHSYCCDEHAICCSQPCIAPSVAAPEHISKVLARGSVVSPKTGRSFGFAETDEPGTEEDLRQDLAGRLSPFDRMASSNSGEFLGNDRKVAKTSIASAPIEDKKTLARVLQSLHRVDDDFMLHHTPKITEAEDSDRVDEENRNVHFFAYLYATKKEADNDYHLILGTTDSPTDSEFMTAEVSGLPRTGPDRTKLKAARKSFEEEFADSPIGTRYKKFDVPIPVELTGSLFFDVDHRAGVVGPEGFKPQTAWEVHPVTEIVFEPSGS
jgi:hypothetical protein